MPVHRLQRGVTGAHPFWTSASISVPGAPASSLVDRQPAGVLKPGAEIFAPVCVAIALLCTFQPLAPRSMMSLAPVATGAGARRTAAAAAGLPGASEDQHDQGSRRGNACELG